MGKITIREIAKLCGVSVSSVSRAMNDHPAINEETKQRILEVIREHGYVPNNSARNLKRTEANAIAVLIKGVANPFFGEMIAVFEQEANQASYTLILQHVEDFEDEVEVALQLVKEKRLKGIVFLGAITKRTDRKLERLDVPYVLSTVDASGLAADCACVTVDHRKESCRLVEYLCALGHRRIALLTSGRGDISIGAQRHLGYRDALKKQGLSYDEELVAWTKEENPAYSMENGYRLTKELLDAGKEFSSIYAISDTMAVGACRALLESGRRIPADCAVAGFDGLEIATYYTPSITTMRQPRAAIAKATMDLMLDLIAGIAKQRRVLFEAELVVGESTEKI